MLHCMGRSAEQGGGKGKGSTFKSVYGHSETGQFRPDLGALLGALLMLSFQQYL